MKEVQPTTYSGARTPKVKLQFPAASHLAILGGYFVLTLVMTWPAVLYLMEGIPGDGFDGWQNYWNLWWVKQALLEERTTPFFTHYLDAPTGASLIFHTLNIFNGLWTLPIQLNFGLVLAYNSVVFFSFVFSGYGGFLLSLYTLTQLFPASRSLRPIAFVGGLVFTMSPFHFAHLLGHMQVFSMVWPPFYVLWLLRVVEPWSRIDHVRSRQNWSEVAICCLFLILASTVAWYHTLYLLIFTAFVLLWALWRRWQIFGKQNSQETDGADIPRGKSTLLMLQPLWRVFLIGLGSAIVLSPLLIPMILDAHNRPDLETGLVQNITLSADLLAFVTPSEMHPLWGKWAASLADNFSTTTSERMIFAGFLPLILALFIIVRSWTNQIIKFWTVIIFLFFLLAIGPYLHIGGKIVTIGNWEIPMPYLLLYQTIPFLDLTRSLSRYDMMVMLGLGVLVAVALAQLAVGNLRTSALEIDTSHRVSEIHSSGSLWRRPYLLSLIAGIVICFEFLAIPYPISLIDTPQFYFEIGAQSEDFTIAELPMNWDRPTPLLHQTVHGKRLLTAYTSRDNPLELAWRTPVFQHWRSLGSDILDQPLKQVAPTIFYDFNLRYIVLDYWQMPPGPERDRTEQWVLNVLPEGLAPVYDDGRLRVYHSPAKEDTHPYLMLGNGWGDREEHQDGSVSRTASVDSDHPAELYIHHPQERSLSLDITAASAQQIQIQVTIFANGKPIDVFPVTATFARQTINLPIFRDNPVKLTFQAEFDTPVVVRRIALRQHPDL